MKKTLGAAAIAAAILINGHALAAPRVLTLGFLGTGFWMVYRRPQATMPEGSYCPRSLSGPWIKVALWISTVLILAAVAFPYAAPLILDV